VWFPHLCAFFVHSTGVLRGAFELAPRSLLAGLFSHCVFAKNNPEDAQGGAFVEHEA
jgi:hypothetical protein